MARRKTEIFGRLQVFAPALDDVLAAVDLHRLHRLPFWDALVVRAAMASRCSGLFSEDLQAGGRLSERWLKRLGRSAQSDSAELIREDRVARCDR